MTASQYSDTQVYVNGLVFNAAMTEVLLVRKTHPEAQAHRWNAIGGRVREDELRVITTSYDMAIARVCTKEAPALSVLQWTPLGKLMEFRHKTVVYWHTATIPQEVWERLPYTALNSRLPEYNTEREIVVKWPVADVYESGQTVKFVQLFLTAALEGCKMISVVDV